MNEKELREFIGKQIKFIRKQKNLTQRELGEKLNVDNSTISSYERGVINFTLNTLYAIATALDVSIDIFFPSGQNDGRLHGVLLNDSHKLGLEELLFMNNLMNFIDKLDEEKRKNLLDNLDLTVEFFKKRNQ